MSKPLLVGVDPHRKTNAVCLMDREGHAVERSLHGRHPTTALLAPSGFSALMERVRASERDCLDACPSH